MNTRIIPEVLFLLFLLRFTYALDIVIPLPDSERTINIDSFREEEKIYIHLPSLFIKIDGAISVQDNLVKVLLNNKNASIDFQNNLASINEPSTTKLIKFQSQMKLWQDTIWIEFNDARTLMQYIIGSEITIKDKPQEKKNNIDTNQQRNPISEIEIPEQELLENIETSSETIQQKNKFSLNNILIDPGHGGEDKGITFPSGKYEKDITLLFAYNLDAQLKKNGINTVLSRKEDKLLSIKERSNIITNEKINYFISIHTEAPRIQGPQILIILPKLTDNNINTKNNYIIDEMIKLIKEKKKDITVQKLSFPLLINNYVDIPGILIEIYPEYKENEDKWEVFIDKKAEIYTIITQVISTTKNNMDSIEKK